MRYITYCIYHLNTTIDYNYYGSFGSDGLVRRYPTGPNTGIAQYNHAGKVSLESVYLRFISSFNGSHIFQRIKCDMIRTLYYKY